MKTLVSLSLSLLTIVHAGATAEDIQTNAEPPSRPQTSPGIRSKEGAGPRIKPKDFFRTLQSDDFVPGTIYVQFRADASPESCARIHATAGAGGILDDYGDSVPGLMRVSVPPGDEHKAILRYLDDPDVLYAEPLYSVYSMRIPNDTRYGELWGMASIRAPQVWDYWTGDPEFRVAVLDGGIETSHTDLSENIWTNPGEIAGNGIDDDGNGRIDDIHGWNVCDGNGTVDPTTCPHGVHVAGTIGARGNNAEGVTGVNWEVKLVSLKLNEGTGQCNGCGDPVAALDYALDNGIKVSNNSWEISGFSQALFNMIQRGQSLGHIFVAAAGNGGADMIGDDNDATPHYPSGYALDNVIAVAAQDSFFNILAGFSNYGETTVDLAAPGVDILSTVRDGEYALMNGTSMATPHVAGVVALLYSRFPYLTWQQVRSRILGGVIHEDAYTDRLLTEGRLDASRPMGLWVNYDFFGIQRGTWAEPYNNIQDALPEVPSEGHLFIWSTTQNFTGTLTEPIFIDAVGGTVTLGQQ